MTAGGRGLRLINKQGRWRMPVEVRDEGDSGCDRGIGGEEEVDEGDGRSGECGGNGKKGRCGC